MNNRRAPDLGRAPSWAEIEAEALPASPRDQRESPGSALEVGGGHTSRGALFALQKRSVQAEAALRRALDVYRSALGESHQQVAKTLAQLGRVLRDRGDLAGAEALFRQAHQVFVGSVGEKHPAARALAADYAKLLRQTGKATEAAALER